MRRVVALPARQAAEKLALSYSTVHRLIAKQELVAIRSGARWRVLLWEIVPTGSDQPIYVPAQKDEITAARG